MKVPSIRQGEARGATVTTQRDVPAVQVPPSDRPLNYLRRLWLGTAPLPQIIWRDMVLFGTLINVAAMVLAIVSVALGASTATGIALYMSPAPWNIFLVASVWRTAGVQPSEWSWPARIGSLIWLVLVFLI